MATTSSSEQQDLVKLEVQELPSEGEAEVTPTKTKFRQRLLNRDRRRFNKYIQSTTTHGVVYIFVGKSKIRRVFWLVIVLTAFIGCLYNVINRIVFLAKGPTSTTVSILEPESVHFPAVTLCNLNLIKKSFLDGVSLELGELIREAFYAQGTDLECNEAVQQFARNGAVPLNELSFPDLLWHGRHTAEETIFFCRFMGQDCNTSDFLPVLTSAGVCYTFNSGKQAQIQKANGTGTRFALTLIASVLQNEYNAALNQDAGIKIAVHPQSEPPQPDELGIAIPPGKNAFVSVRQKNIVNRSTKKRCRDTSDTTSFNFLQGGFSYSVSACQIDCLRTNIAQKCRCLGGGGQASSNSQFRNLHNCTVANICCLVTEISRASTCHCQEACKKTLYVTETTYSAFPANYAARDLADSVKAHFNVTINASVFQENFLGVNVYFETLTVGEQVTSNAYDAIALLSDIGGQLGLFLGASVISVFELVTWLFDEIKDRCFGISERKLVGKVKSRVDALKRMHYKLKKVERNGAESDVSDENQGNHDYRNFESL